MNRKNGAQAAFIDVRKVIENQNDLFALPDAAVKILQLSGNDEVGIDMLSNLISRDPALAGRLLKIANSAFYGLNRRISNIQQAVMVLGLTTVKCMILSVAIFDPFKISNDLGINIRAIYGSIISAATICRKLAIATQFRRPEDAFTCGLLHEIGLLFLLQNYPDGYKKILDRGQEDIDVLDEEKKLFGLPHTEAGRLLARKWQLPEEFVSAIGNHHSFGFKDSQILDDIVRLGVILNLGYTVGPEGGLEEKITKLSAISSRLGLSTEQLDDMTSTTVKETMEFARTLDIDIGDLDSILSRANQEIFKTYISVQRLFKERQDLTRHILDEERQKGILEAKQVAISTLSHYINNASMIIYGQSQVLRMMLNQKRDDKIVGDLPRMLGIIDDSIRKIVAVLEEISELNMLDEVEYFDQSKILNIDDRIQERLARLKNFQLSETAAETCPLTE